MHAQADALDIESAAKRRLADEYDAAQERGEVRGANERTASNAEAVGAAEIGLTHKEIHEARQFRDAERDDPGTTQQHSAAPAPLACDVMLWQRRRAAAAWKADTLA